MISLCRCSCASLAALLAAAKGSSPFILLGVDDDEEDFFSLLPAGGITAADFFWAVAERELAGGGTGMVNLGSNKRERKGTEREKER